MKFKIATLAAGLMLAVTPMASAGVIDSVNTTSGNLEDWRPKVSDARMIATQCNP